MQRHYDLNGDVHVLVQDNKRDLPIIKKGQDNQPVQSSINIAQATMFK